MLRPGFIAFVATVLPLVARAECPTDPSDLVAGVIVAYDGLEITYQLEPDGRVRETERHPKDTEVWVYITERNGLPLESWMLDANGRPDEASRETSTYVFATGAPEPKPGTAWEGRRTTASGAERWESAVTWVYGAPETFAIGDCSYEALRMVERDVELPSGAGAPAWINHYVYLSDIDLALYLGGDEEGVEPFLEVPLSIGVVGR